VVLYSICESFCKLSLKVIVHFVAEINKTNRQFPASFIHLVRRNLPLRLRIVDYRLEDVKDTKVLGVPEDAGGDGRDGNFLAAILLCLEERVLYTVSELGPVLRACILLKLMINVVQQINCLLSTKLVQLRE
jgi:hypothetical protein